MAPRKDAKTETKKGPKAKLPPAETADSAAPASEEQLDARQMKVQQTLFAQVCQSADATADQKAALERYKYYFKVTTSCFAYVRNVSVSSYSDFAFVYFLLAIST